MASYPVLENGMASPHHIHVDFNTTGFNQNGGLTVGQRGSLRDGRVYYWTRNGTTTSLVRAQMLIMAINTANHSNQAVNAAADFTIGSNTVTLNPAGTAIALEEYVEGFACVLDGTGEGFMYKIKAHAGNAGSTQSEATLYEEVVVSTAGGATVSLVRNPYSDPLISVTDGADIAVGVPNATIAAATTVASNTVTTEDPSFGWVQTWGLCSVLADISTTSQARGASLKQGDTAGSVSALASAEADGAAADHVIAVNYEAPDDNEHWPVDLRIKP